MNNEQNFIYGDITYEILSAAFEVHNTLGAGFLEKVYENALCVELERRQIDYQAQKEISVYYKDKQVGMYCADLIVDKNVVVELKSVDVLTKTHEAQLLNYLKATGKKLGLLVNFGKGRVEYRRFIL